jgi:broad specificity polyphosphatase/5'/3'-nucleotidase SurE
VSQPAVTADIRRDDIIISGTNTGTNVPVTIRPAMIASLTDFAIGGFEGIIVSFELTF